MCKYKSNELKELYNLFGYQYDGYLIRRPKISIVLDDVSADSYMSSNNNFFY